MGELIVNPGALHFDLPDETLDAIKELLKDPTAKRDGFWIVGGAKLKLKGEPFDQERGDKAQARFIPPTTTISFLYDRDWPVHLFNKLLNRNWEAGDTVKEALTTHRIDSDPTTIYVIQNTDWPPKF